MHQRWVVCKGRETGGWRHTKGTLWQASATMHSPLCSSWPMRRRQSCVRWALGGSRSCWVCVCVCVSLCVYMRVYVYVCVCAYVNPCSPALRGRSVLSAGRQTLGRRWGYFPQLLLPSCSITCDLVHDYSCRLFARVCSWQAHTLQTTHECVSVASTQLCHSILHLQVITKQIIYQDLHVQFAACTGRKQACLTHLLPAHCKDERPCFICLI